MFIAFLDPHSQIMEDITIHDCIFDLCEQSGLMTVICETFMEGVILLLSSYTNKGATVCQYSLYLKFTLFVSELSIDRATGSILSPNYINLKRYPIEEGGERMM